MRDALPVVEGFRFAGAAAGVKAEGLDAGLIAADRPVPAAGVFTENLVRAAPVELASARLVGGRAQAVLVNSGNANACTGKRGMRDAERSTAAVAEALGIDSALVLPASTGVIGEVLPSGALEGAAPVLVDGLADGAAMDFARAILTTDKGPKVAHTQVAFGKRRATVVAIAKGAGMIHPRMATTLGFVLTDAPVHVAALRRALRRATDRSFNALTVDGETSTNDTLVAMASGRLEVAPLKGGDRRTDKLEDAFADVLEQVGKMIVADGEGAEHLVRVQVSGAPSEKAARKVAERVATSLLVKTALHGCDANWGRILSAAGTTGVRFDPAKVEIRFEDVPVYKRGRPAGAQAEAAAKAVMQRPEYTLHVRLGAGKAQAHYHTCDLGHAYVGINAGYRT